MLGWIGVQGRICKRNHHPDSITRYEAKVDTWSGTKRTIPWEAWVRSGNRRNRDFAVRSRPEFVMFCGPNSPWQSEMAIQQQYEGAFIIPPWSPSRVTSAEQPAHPVFITICLSFAFWIIGIRSTRGQQSQRNATHEAPRVMVCIWWWRDFHDNNSCKGYQY